MKFFKLLGVLSIAALASCHTQKKMAANTKPQTPAKDSPSVSHPKVVKDSATLAKEVLDNWQNSRLSYRTLSGKLGVSIKMPNLDQSISANLRSAKDSLLWISLTGPFGIEGARAKITTDSAIVVNKLNATVEKRSIAYIQNLVHQPLSFADIQNILTGRMLLQNATVQSRTGNKDGTWDFVFRQDNIQNRVTIDPVNNRILENQLTDLSRPSRTCHVQYRNFQNTSAGWMPWNIHIVAQDTSPVDIELTYRQVNFNQTLDYPFNIPGKYSVRQ